MPDATPLAVAYPVAASNPYLAKANADRGPYGILTPSYGLASANPQQGQQQNTVPVAQLGSSVPANFLGGNGAGFRNALTNNPAQAAISAQLNTQLAVMTTLQLASQFLLGAGLLAMTLMK
jgi:hypothetical protein